MVDTSCWPGNARFAENAAVSGSGTYGRIVTKRSLAVIGLLGTLATACGGGSHATVTKAAAPSPLPSSAAPSASKVAVASPSAITTDPLTGLAAQHSSIVV